MGRLRVNGFERPVDPLQITGWSFIIGFMIIFFTLMAPVIPSPGDIVVFVLGGIGATIVIGTMLVGSYVNPADDHVDCTRRDEDDWSARDNHRKGKSPFDNSTYCYLCKVYVEKNAKHCRVCDKCVSDFDHHCKWLNNCVGGKNYRIFFSVVVSTLVTALFILGVALYLIATVASDNADVMAQLKSKYPKLGKGGYIAILVCTCLLLCLTITLLAQLFGLHVFLFMNNMSTYDYIISQRKKKKQAELDAKTPGKTKDKGAAAGGKKGKVYAKPGGPRQERGTFATGTPGNPDRSGSQGKWYLCGRRGSSAAKRQYATKKGTTTGSGDTGDTAPLTPSSRNTAQHTQSAPPPLTPSGGGKPPRPPRPAPVSTTNAAGDKGVIVQAGLPETPTWRQAAPKPAGVHFDASADSTRTGQVGLAYPIKKIDFSSAHRAHPTSSGDIPSPVPVKTAHSASSVRLSQRSSVGSVRSTTSTMLLTGRDWAEAGVVDPNVISTTGRGAPSPVQAQVSAGSVLGTPPASPSLHFSTPDIVRQSAATSVPEESQAPF